MKYHEAGIRKKASENVFPKDFLAERTLIGAPNEIWGVYFKLLLHLWHENSYAISGTPDEFADLFSCSKSQALLYLKAFVSRKIVTVTVRNGIYTLTQRRLKRRANVKVQGKKRVQNFRRRELVTDLYSDPSLSLSLSTSCNPLTPKGEQGFVEGNGKKKTEKEIRAQIWTLSKAQEALEKESTALNAKHRFEHTDQREKHPVAFKRLREINTKARKIRKALADLALEID